MSETKYELPAWCNGLIVFLFTPALLFVLLTAFLALVLVVAMALVINIPVVIWCAITGQKYELWPMNQNQNEKRSRKY